MSEDFKAFKELGANLQMHIFHSNLQSFRSAAEKFKEKYKVTPELRASKVSGSGNSPSDMEAKKSGDFLNTVEAAETQERRRRRRWTNSKDWDFNKSYSKTKTIFEGQLACGNAPGQARGASVGVKLDVTPDIAIDIKFGYYIHVPWWPGSSWAFNTYFNSAGHVAAQLDLVLSAAIKTKKELLLLPSTPIPDMGFSIGKWFSVGPAVELAAVLESEAEIEAKVSLKTGFNWKHTKTSIAKSGHSSHKKGSSEAATPETKGSAELKLSGSIAALLELKLDAGVKLHFFGEDLLDVEAGIAVSGGLAIKAQKVYSTEEEAKMEVGLHAVADMSIYYKGEVIGLGNTGDSKDILEEDWPLLTLSTYKMNSKKGQERERRLAKFDGEAISGTPLTNIVLSEFGLTCGDFFGKEEE
eukprot:Pgem_evm1s16540